MTKARFSAGDTGGVVGTFGYRPPALGSARDVPTGRVDGSLITTAPGHRP